MACIYMFHPAGAHELYVLPKGLITLNDVRQLLPCPCGQVVPCACSVLYGLAAGLLQVCAGAEGVGVFVIPKVVVTGNHAAYIPQMCNS